MRLCVCLFSNVLPQRLNINAVFVVVLLPIVENRENSKFISLYRSSLVPSDTRVSDARRVGGGGGSIFRRPVLSLIAGVHGRLTACMCTGGRGDDMGL